MSRGRKAKANNTNLSWQQIFSKNVGKYLQYAIIELGKVDNNQTETGADLLKKIKAEKGKIKKEKELPPIKVEEIPYEIPENWVWCRLGEIIEFTDNLNIETKFSADTLINYVDIEAIDNQKHQIRESKLKPVSELSSRARRVLRKGYIVYSLVRPYLNNIAIVEDEKPNYIGSTGFAVFNGILVDNRFLKVFLLSEYVRELYLKTFSGFNSPSITQEQFASTLIPLPSISIQQKIVDFLTDCENDNLKEDGYYFNQEVEQKVIALHKVQLKSFEIANELTYQLSLVKNLRQQLLQDAVQGKLVKNADNENVVEVLNLDDVRTNRPDVRTSETGAQLLKRIKKEKEQLIKDKKLKKEKELPSIKVGEIPFEIPDDWVWCRLGEIAEIGTGATPLTGNIEYYQNGTIPWITSSATNNLFVDEAEQFITEKALKETNCTIYPQGTLLVAMYGQGKTRGQITELNIDAATNQACATITFFLKDYYLRKYIKLFFRKIYDEIRELAQGGAQPNLNMGKIRDTIIPLPPLSMQHHIVSKVESLLSVCTALETGIGESVRANELLLQQVLREALGG